MSAASANLVLASLVLQLFVVVVGPTGAAAALLLRVGGFARATWIAMAVLLLLAVVTTVAVVTVILFGWHLAWRVNPLEPWTVPLAVSS